MNIYIRRALSIAVWVWLARFMFASNGAAIVLSLLLIWLALTLWSGGARVGRRPPPQNVTPPQNVVPIAKRRGRR